MHEPEFAAPRRAGCFPAAFGVSAPLASAGPMRAMYPYGDRTRGPVISRNHHIRVKCGAHFFTILRVCFLNYPSSDGVARTLCATSQLPNFGNGSLFIITDQSRVQVMAADRSNDRSKRVKISGADGI